MDDPSVMSCLDRRANLGNDARYFIGGKGRTPLGVLLEKLAVGPLHGQVMEVTRHSNVEGPDNIRVRDAAPELGFSCEAGNGGLLLAELLAQHLEGDGPVNGVLGAIYHGRSALAHEGLKRITRDGTTDEVALGHGAEPNDPRRGQQGKRAW